MFDFVESIALFPEGAPLLPYHQKRFESTQIETWGQIVHPTLLSLLPICPGEGLYKARFLYNEKSFAWDVRPYHRRALKILRLVHTEHADYHLKYLNKSLFEKLKKGCGPKEDILIVVKGRVTDTSFSNVAFFDGQKWLTPAFPLLKGTRRAELLDKKIIFEQDIAIDNIKYFSKIALFNALVNWDLRIEFPVSHIVYF